MPSKRTEQARIAAIISDLKRCAKQNEADAKALNDAGAGAVAAEQRRMVRILNLERKEVEREKHERDTARRDPSR